MIVLIHLLQFNPIQSKTGTSFPTIGALFRFLGVPWVMDLELTWMEKVWKLIFDLQRLMSKCHKFTL